MKHSLARLTACALMIGTVGCEETPETPEIRVLTWNVYVGASLDAVLSETDPAMVPVRVAEAWAEFQSTDFAARAEALAEEIASERPDLVGLQEMSNIFLQSPGDYLNGNPYEASDEMANFLDTLLDELAERGMSYTAIAISDGYDIELPMLVHPDSLYLNDIRLQDHEVLLARDGVEVGITTENDYETNLLVQSIGGLVTMQRGWVSAEVEIGGQVFLFVSTHLETAENSPTVQEAQAAELISALSTVDLPIILVGDFNSDADGSTTGTYADLLAAGFMDAWLEGDPAESEYTCCQLSNLSNTSSGLDRRIDYILFSAGAGFVVKDIVRVGEDPLDRTSSGLWPSDHAGLSAVFRLP